MVQVPRTAPFRPLTRKEFDALVDLGFFQNERIELIGGFIVEMSPIGSRHAGIVDGLAELFVMALRQRGWARSQQPFAANDVSLVEPDLAIVARKDYLTAHPAQASLIIEVADSSLVYDQTDKAALYAAAPVDEYWIVNLVENVVEVHRERDLRGSWQKPTLVRRGGSLSPKAFPDIVLAVDELLRLK